MPFGQVVVGPPGSGKSTYCFGMHQFLSAIGRQCIIVNLDPANDFMSYPCAIDIRKVIDIETIQNDYDLGPNGALIFAMETIEYHVDWLCEELEAHKDTYVIIDCPGQVELFTDHDSLQKIISTLSKRIDFRPVVVQLVDSFCCTDPAAYISALLVCLKGMLQLDLPHINVLSKADLLSSYAALPMNLDFYTNVEDLSYLTPILDRDPRLIRYSQLNKTICELIEEFGLVSFEVLAVENKVSMLHLLQKIDQAGGYSYGSTEIGGDIVWANAVRQGGDPLQDVSPQERWIDRREEYDRYEREMEEKYLEESQKVNEEEEPY
ncbi:ATP binding protein [Schizosaccharomyces octosporus yFS286]|uniref:GPN-loop GTPase 2 n=1 Tax=Schizosaccharomyces octosporus (strain yFS286) TaxID=483514 RepID=S9PVR8_SCHOY|nr:ATP binding protein [Schizosaccharomyces octosporus yFS286]EPX73196.1 ATP binding protein [Schizosaccharomyces octosporus yFS286]